MDELDGILLEQLHVAKRQRKVIRRLRRMFGHDSGLEKGEISNDKRIEFFESMINDKSLLHKRQRRKKDKDQDILTRSPIYLAYRNVFFFTTFSYHLFLDSATRYASYIKKGRKKWREKEQPYLDN